MRREEHFDHNNNSDPCLRGPKLLNYLGLGDFLKSFRVVRLNFGFSAQIDFLTWFAAILVAGLLRFELDFRAINLAVFAVVGVVSGTLGFFVGTFFGIYSERFAPAKLDELLALSYSALVTSAPLALLGVFIGPSIDLPRSAVPIALPLFILGSVGRRVARRVHYQIRNQPAGARRTLIYGAGAMSEDLVPQLLGDRESRFFPVGLIDDDPLKSDRRIAGVKTEGTLSDLSSVANETGAESLIVSIPTATSELLQRVSAAAAKVGLSVHVLPSLSEVLERSDEKISVRDLDIESLIGRRAVSVDSPRVRTLIADQTVLVTGAGGSIGVELCRQVAEFKPKRLLFLDRDETGLQHAQMVAQRSGLLNSTDLVLADIRDEREIQRVFSIHSPDVVFHAAALKHLPMLERFPSEAWKTNVIGSLNVLKAAREHDVGTFVNISTDKAADPSSILGRSKRLAEGLTAWASIESSGNFLSVRFGNVLGSRGSLVPTLDYMIKNAGKVEITDPRATRYFMTTSEACQLVLQAGTETTKNSIFVLDMGSPVKILDIAERMISMAGTSTPIQFTGLRRGEKLHEVLFAPAEQLEPSSHKLIHRIQAETLDPRGLEHFRALFEE